MNSNFDFTQENDLNKPNILFIHGFGATKAFVNKLKVLTRKYNIIALSLPQRAKTELPTASIEAFGNYVKAFIAEQKLTDFYILGHSLGGAVISYLHDQKEIKQFILCTPLHPEATFEYKQMHSWLLPTNLTEAQASINSLVYDLNTWQGHHEFVAQNSLKYMQEVRNFFLPMVEKEILNPAYLQAKIAHNYEQIKDRAIIIGAFNDLYITWNNLQKTAKRFAIKDHLIQNCGHVPIFEKPLIVNQIIEQVIGV